MASFPAAAAPHFGELATRYALIPTRYEANANSMLRLAELARQAGGGFPVRVTSWYRPAAWNSLVGGSPHSQHLTASAMDFVPIGEDIRSWFDHVRQRLPGSEFGQLIYERSHVHLSLPNRTSGETGEVLLEPREGHYVSVATLKSVQNPEGGDGSIAIGATRLGFGAVVLIGILLVVILG